MDNRYSDFFSSLPFSAGSHLLLLSRIKPEQKVYSCIYILRDKREKRGERERS